MENCVLSEVSIWGVMESNSIAFVNDVDKINPSKKHCCGVFAVVSERVNGIVKPLGCRRVVRGWVKQRVVPGM